jgi:hypothetical protein
MIAFWRGVPAPLPAGPGRGQALGSGTTASGRAILPRLAPPRATGGADEHLPFDGGNLLPDSAARRLGRSWRARSNPNASACSWAALRPNQLGKHI